MKTLIRIITPLVILTLWKLNIFSLDKVVWYAPYIILAILGFLIINVLLEIWAIISFKKTSYYRRTHRVRRNRILRKPKQYKIGEGLR